MCRQVDFIIDVLISEFFIALMYTHTLIILAPHGVAQFSLECVDVLLMSVDLVLQRFDLTNGLVLGLNKSSY